MRKSIIYELKDKVRGFITFEKLSINNIHFGFNQSNSYYLMGKNSSVNGEVMFKFDASKYDIKDGNVTFRVWSPDIPSLGSIPIPASSMQGSTQSQTGNAPKLGYSSVSAESPRYFYLPELEMVKIPYIYLEVTNSFAFSVTIRVKLFDPNDNPMPYKKIRIIVELYGGILEWVKDTIWGIIFAPKVPLYNNNFQNCTDFNGERIIQITLNVSPYIKFGTLYVYASFEEDYWLWWPLLRIPAGTIYTSLTMLVGKKVTIPTYKETIENDIRAIVSIIISGCISETFLSKVESKYYDLRQRAYSPQNLQKLVEIIQYDLTLLNYEIILWDQLKD
jgi:hypothetical protein